MERKLAEVKVSRKKILLYVAMRLPWIAMFVLAIIVGIHEMENANHATTTASKEVGVLNYVALGAMGILIFIYVFSPFRHWKDVLIYYDNKIVFRKKVFTFQDPSEIKWFRTRGRGSGLTGPRLLLYKHSGKRGIKEIFFPSDQMDVTYMCKPKEQFIKSYLGNDEVSVKNVK